MVGKAPMEKTSEFRKQNEKEHDVTFYIGEDKRPIKASQKLLKAASLTFEKWFQQYTNGLEEYKKELEITLPELDATYFELFLNLAMHGTWSVDHLRKLELHPSTIIRLLADCHSAKLWTGVAHTKEILSDYIRNFHIYKDTKEFFELSQADLEVLISNDAIPMREADILASTYKWAVHHCLEIERIPANIINMRKALGRCLYQIRFPLMSREDFREVTRTFKLLRPEEFRAIYKYFDLRDENRELSITKEAKEGLPFPINPRVGRSPRPPQLPLPKGFSTSTKLFPIPLTLLELEKIPGVKTLSLVQLSSMIRIYPVVCNGTLSFVKFWCNRPIHIYGVSFVGPIESDSVYEATVSLYDEKSKCVLMKGSKTIAASKGQVFNFIFDKSFIFKPNFPVWRSASVQIQYSLKGPNTYAVARSIGEETIVRKGKTEFVLKLYNQQLAAVLYKTEKQVVDASRTGKAAGIKTANFSRRRYYYDG